MPKTMQTKCKTCFGGPRMILYGFKKHTILKTLRVKCHKNYLFNFLNISLIQMVFKTLKQDFVQLTTHTVNCKLENKLNFWRKKLGEFSKIFCFFKKVDEDFEQLTKMVELTFSEFSKSFHFSKVLLNLLFLNSPKAFTSLRFCWTYFLRILRKLWLLWGWAHLHRCPSVPEHIGQSVPVYLRCLKCICRFSSRYINLIWSYVAHFSCSCLHFCVLLGLRLLSLLFLELVVSQCSLISLGSLDAHVKAYPCP